jgi:TonB family protein
MNTELPLYSKYTVVYLFVTILGGYIATELSRADIVGILQPDRDPAPSEEKPSLGVPSKKLPVPAKRPKPLKRKPAAVKAGTRGKTVDGRSVNRKSTEVSDCQPDQHPSPVPSQQVAETLHPDRTEEHSMSPSLNVTPNVAPSAIAPREPVLVAFYKPSPEYPRLALDARMSGSVRLFVGVAANGSVREVRTLEGNPILAAAAKEAVAQWKYPPYDASAGNLLAWAQVTINFSRY